MPSRDYGNQGRMWRQSAGRSRTLARVSPDAVIVACCYNPFLDDQGRAKGDAQTVLLAMPAVTIMHGWDEERMEAALGQLTEQHYYIRYEVEGETYVQAAKWWEHQELQWAYPSAYPAPGGWQDRLRYIPKGQKHPYTSNWSSTPDSDAEVASEVATQAPTIAPADAPTQAKQSSIKQASISKRTLDKTKAILSIDAAADSEDTVAALSEHGMPGGEAADWVQTAPDYAAAMHDRLEDDKAHNKAPKSDLAWLRGARRAGNYAPTSSHSSNRRWARTHRATRPAR